MNGNGFFGLAFCQIVVNTDELIVGSLNIIFAKVDNMHFYFLPTNNNPSMSTGKKISAII